MRDGSPALGWETSTNGEDFELFAGSSELADLEAVQIRIGGSNPLEPSAPSRRGSVT